MASGTGPPNSGDERRPLLESRIGSSYVDVRADPETAAPTDEPEVAEIVVEKAPADHSRAFWCLAFATFGGLLLWGIIKGFVENGDIKVVSVVYCPAIHLSLTWPVVRLQEGFDKGTRWRVERRCRYERFVRRLKMIYPYLPGSYLQRWCCKS